MIPVVSYSAFRRPDYTRETLGALGRNFGASGYRLVAAVDVDEAGRVNQQVLDIIHGQTWPAAKEVYVMPKHVGANGTIRTALSAASLSSDYVVHVEDDVLVARDALAYFAWAGEAYRNDPAVFTVTAWRHPDGYLGPVATSWTPASTREIMPNESAMVRREGTFSCWGWATWADRWREIDANWTDQDDYKLSWDQRLTAVRHPRVQIAPLISRAVNIGAIDGAHRGHFPLPYWRGSESFTEAPAFIES